MAHHCIVKLHKGKEKRLKAGHLWVYAGEILEVHGNPEPGGLVDVVSHNGRFLGRAYFNAASVIRARILTTEEEEIDRAFFTRRIRTALEYRLRFYTESDSFRVVHGDGDMLPGLVVDKLGDIAVVQILSLGIEVRRDDVLRAVHDVLEPRGIYERSDVSVRRLEGLELRKGPLMGSFAPRFMIRENDVMLTVDVAEGQKTGYFLDQKENRRALAGLVRNGDSVLDAFCHTGTFGAHAAQYGAGSVTFLDISDAALVTARENSRLNGFEDRSSFVLGNAFDVLRQMEREKQAYDVVVLDPPAFTKSKGSIEGAVRGYKEVNIRGLKLTKRGGFLVTCSCSHHMSRDMFMQVVVEAGADSGRRMRLVEYRSQSKDHPILVGMPETEYLKCAIFQVL